MTSIDEKIKQALSDEYNDIIAENEKTDANPFKQMIVGFKSKMGWMYMLIVFFSTLSAFFMFYSIYKFYHETDIKTLLGWGVAIVVATMLNQMSKMWYWSELSRNRVIREVKLLELQVAQVLKNQESS